MSFCEEYMLRSAYIQNHSRKLGTEEIGAHRKYQPTINSTWFAIMIFFVLNFWPRSQERISFWVWYFVDISGWAISSQSSSVHPLAL